MIRPDKNLYILSQGFSKAHPGNDFTTTVGKPIYAPEAGRVVMVNNDPNGYFGGCYVVIEGVSGYRHYLGHNSKNLVAVFQNVNEGQQVALIGKTGFSDGVHPAPTGPHVHWGCSKGGVDVDGLKLITEEGDVMPQEQDVTNYFLTYLGYPPTAEQMTYYVTHNWQTLASDVCTVLLNDKYRLQEELANSGQAGTVLKPGNYTVK